MLLCVTFGVFLVAVSTTRARPSRAAQPKLAPSAPSVETDGEGRPLYHPGVITVKVKEGVGPFAPQQEAVTFGLASLDEKAVLFQVQAIEKRFRHKPIPPGSGLPDLSRIYRLTFPESFGVRAVAGAFSGDPHVEYGEPIPLCYKCDVPNDSLYSQLQHLPQIMAEEAWDIHHGEDCVPEIVIGIPDDALEWFHPDIVQNVWQNLGEDADGDGHVLEFIGGSWAFDPGDENAIDDDGNGFVDDFIGWNFMNEFDQEDNDPAPDHPGDRHGTRCGGISAGATDNQIGIASISWNLKIMGTKHANDGEGYYDSDPYAGVIYCAENGAHIISNSWGGYGYSQAGADVIAYATGLGTIVVAAAGNEESDQVFYPGGYPGCISVASVAVTDAMALYSNYGIAIDVSAPGGDTPVDGGILSTIPGGYAEAQGTSFSSPLAAGLLGLIKSYHPEWSNEEIAAQLIGTTDDIDAQNPGYEGMLGSGRINAFRALSETGVEVPHELRLGLFDVAVDDQDGDGAIEQGETVTLSLTLRNYAHAVSTDDASFTLDTTDPDITLLVDSCDDSIPADDYFMPGNGFEIEIAGDASSHVATLTLHVDAGIDIAFGEEMSFGLFIEPSGVLVWDGATGGHDYSGAYISSFLAGLGLEVSYTTAFPAALSAFDALFLSFGNFGSGSTGFGDDLAGQVEAYLEDGGYVYLEGGDALGFDQAENTALQELLSLAGAEDGPQGPTVIRSLAGQTGAFTEGMLFTSSTQAGNEYIDTFTPNQDGSVAFVENSYGNVAVQGTGAFGQKTFCFSYALGELVDRDTLSNRYSLLAQIVDFFELPLEPGHLVAGLVADATTGYAPMEVQFSDISVTDEAYPVVGWEWDLDGDGTVDSYERNPAWTYSETGDYSVNLIVHNGVRSDTCMIPDYIRVVGSGVSGTWSIAGSPYYVNEEIGIADGDVLVIEPGVEVVFTGHYGLRVEGSLQAVGTEQDSILFTAQDPDTGWAGITIVPGSLQDDSTKIVYSILEYGWANGGGEPLSSLGGALRVEGVDELLISRCLIRENKASGSCPEFSTGAGGAISLRYASPAISHNAIVENSVSGAAGGISMHYSSPLLAGNLIARNTASSLGGAIACNAACDAIIINNTICGNQGGSYGGGIFLWDDCSPVLRNTILWANSASGGKEVYLTASCDPDFYYCDVAGGVGGFAGDGAGGAFDGAYESCIDAAPLFADPQNGDYHLTWANFPMDDSTKSPCIDAGDPDPQYNDPDSTRNDIGALYFDQTTGAQDEPFAGMTTFHLGWAFPNPFRPGATATAQQGTRMVYSIPATAGGGMLDVLNIRGQVVRSFPVAHSGNSSTDAVVWYGRDRWGRQVGAGLYLYRLTAGGRRATRRMVLVR
jgi:PKD repeat protein